MTDYSLRELRRRRQRLELIEFGVIATVYLTAILAYLIWIVY